MNPDVMSQHHSSYSELQLQFLQHLKIQPLQQQLAPLIAIAVPDTSAVLPADPTPQVADHMASVATAAIQSSAQPEPIAAPTPTPTPTPAAKQQWQLADPAMPLVQDVLQLLRDVQLPAQWFYAATASVVQLNADGLFSVSPQCFQTATAKKALWQQLSMQLPASAPQEAE